MNKKDITEIKRRLNPERNNLTVVRGCYVDSHGDILSRFDLSPYTMPTDEAERYLALFSKVLSGTLEKNLISVNFTSSDGEMPPEQKLLMALRDSALTDDEAVSLMFDKVIASHSSQENYLVLLMHDAYDVPSYSADGQRLEDGSDVFHYILMALCPVRLGKSALFYDGAEKGFHTHIPDMRVAAPTFGLMYPAFENRSANIHAGLYYQKDIKNPETDLTDALFAGAQAPVSPMEQQEAFGAILSDSLGSECSLGLLDAVHTHLRQRIADQKADKTAEPAKVTKRELEHVLAEAGVTDEGVQAFSEAYDDQLGEGVDLSPVNMIDPGKFSLKLPDISIRVTPDRAHLITAQMIDGVKYLLIRADEGVEVNGVNVVIE
ncbi:MAG: DUF4317 domain-containing protein [Clostridia bacterium]|nr:DUF4317 domain-containing protein [Clostridia bacterium]